MAKMTSVLYPLLVLAVHGLVLVLVDATEKEAEIEKKAWACFGNFHNFLDINCPQDRQVEVIAMMNGAKPTNQNCSSITTAQENFRQDCCTFAEGDCVIKTHPNSFPVECFKRSYCKPQSRQADTGPKCYNKVFPEFTHYTQITYRCIIPPSTTTTTTTFTSTTSAAVEASSTEAAVVVGNKSLTVPMSSTATSSAFYTVQPVTLKNIVNDVDDITPAKIGGMIAGIIGLMLTIFIFMFYWGRKRQIRVAGKTQNSVWDFLLSNTMSVRAFRGYDNFSSTSRHSLSSEDGSPVTRKTVWLPNISLDSGHGGSNLTSDDNCSVITVERAAAFATASATAAAAAASASAASSVSAIAPTSSSSSVSAASAARELRVGNVRGSVRGAGNVTRSGSVTKTRNVGNGENGQSTSESGTSTVIINRL